MTFDRPWTLRETLGTLMAQSRPPETVLVLDNKGTAATQAVVAELADARVRYHSMGGNAGPAGAAAYGLRQLSDEGYDWIYWGDDDDPPKTADTLERLLRLGISNQPDVGAVGAVGTRWNWTTGRIMRMPDDALEGTVEVDTIAGSSQLMVSAEAIRNVGLPDERLFFGFEEPEYCLRLRRAGCRLLIDGELMLEYRRLAGRLGLPPSASVRPRRAYADIWRQYYSTRNYIFTMRNTFRRPDLARRETLRAGARMVSSWGHGLRYGSRYCAFQARAVLDGYRGRMGCTVLPAPKGQAQ